MKKLSKLLIIIVALSLIMMVTTIYAEEFDQGIVRVYGETLTQTNSKAVTKALAGKIAPEVIVLDAGITKAPIEAIKLSFEKKIPIILVSKEDNNLALLNQLQTKKIIAFNIEDKSLLKGLENFTIEYKNSEIVELQEVINTLPQTENTLVAMIPVNRLADFISGINLQSVGAYKILPKEKLDPMELNPYDNLVIVGSTKVLDFTTRQYFDDKKTYNWYEAGWILYNNFLLDSLYNSNKIEEKDGKFEIVFKESPFKLKTTNIGNTDYRFTALLDSVLLQSDSDIIVSLYKYDEKMTFYPEYKYVFASKEELNNYLKMNAFIREWVKNNITNELSIQQKSKKIFDWIIAQGFQYTTDNNITKPFYPGSSSSLLQMHKGKCSAFATLQNMLSKSANLSVYLELGHIANSDVFHAWSVVDEQGQKYFIDATSANSSKDVKYKYFYKTSKEFAKMNYIRQ